MSDNTANSRRSIWSIIFKRYKVSINDLPFEMLIKIVSYLPNHKSVALVNHRFYDAVCALDTSLMCTAVYQHSLEKHKYSQSMDGAKTISSILKTRRKIKNLAVTFMLMERTVVINIIKKFAENIEYLRVCGEKASDLIEAISLVPNVNHLEFVLVGFDYLHRQIRNDEELNLSRLRKLNIERSPRASLVMFNRLPAGVLIELTLRHNSLWELGDLFRNQTNIKKLTVVNDYGYGYYEPIRCADLFDNLQLEFLEWQSRSSEQDIFSQILQKQTNLKSLKLVEGNIGVDLMNVITNQLSKLETLSIHIPFDALDNITKLKNLTELTLRSNDQGNIVQLNRFATLDNSKITKLNIQHFFDFFDDLIIAMATSLPNLKMLRFHSRHNVHAILKYFNYVEVLHLYTFEYHEGNISAWMESGCENNKLIELKILSPISYTTKFIEKMAKDYPRLKKLFIIPANRVFGKEYEAILNGFKEIEYLAIRQPLMECRINDLNLMVKYGLNLKFVALMDVDTSTLRLQINKKIKEKFGVMEYSFTDGLKMAINRRAMKIGQEYIERWDYLREVIE